MKKFITFIFVLLFAANTFAASTLTIYNFTSDYTLYFDVVAQKPLVCTPIIRTTNPANGAGYCTLEPDPIYGSSVAFSNFTELSVRYPGLIVYMQGSTVPFSTTALADAVLNNFSMNWSYIIYKVQSPSSPFTEGMWIGFSDFFDCHGLSNWWQWDYQQTGGYAENFTIGGDRYFMVW